MVILVPEITIFPASIGNRTNTFSGSSQLTRMVAVSMKTIVAGIATRSFRTRRL